jgi:2-phosphosulfolactate phosphatase
VVGGEVRLIPEIVCEWGLAGLRSTAAGRNVVIVDVFSFSTAVSVAVSRGAMILPCEWNEERASALARAEGAELAAKRGEGRYTLAPASLRSIPAGMRLVVPSQNGSAIAFAARQAGARSIVAGCLRNAAAVARWLTEQREPVAVIAAGERWPDDTIRFAFEDWLGAGAIISRLDGNRTVEAAAAATAFEALRGSLSDALAGCRSGRELLEADRAEDIDLAAQLDADDVVPLLTGTAFCDPGGTLPRS